jgi:hypothetical protein
VEKAEHLQGTGQSAVSRQQRPEQEPGNLERKTETGMGAGQKKQLSHSGITVVYKCVTHYLYLSYNIFSKKNSFGIGRL